MKINNSRIIVFILLSNFFIFWYTWEYSKFSPGSTQGIMLCLHHDLPTFRLLDSFRPPPPPLPMQSLLLLGWDRMVPYAQDKKWGSRKNRRDLGLRVTLALLTTTSDIVLQSINALLFPWRNSC